MDYPYILIHQEILKLNRTETEKVKLVVLLHPNRVYFYCLILGGTPFSLLVLWIKYHIPYCRYRVLSLTAYHISGISFRVVFI